MKDICRLDAFDVSDGDSLVAVHARFTSPLEWGGIRRGKHDRV